MPMIAREFQSGTIETSRVDPDAGTIHEVSLISTGEAKGHDVYVDEKTLSQIFKCCTKSKTLKVRADHGSGVLSTIGYVDNFKLMENQVIGDLHVYEAEPEKNRIFEIAEKNPRHMGLSLEFCGEDEDQDGKMMARCTELTAVALVSDPAANKSLFEKKVLANSAGFSTKEIDSTKNTGKNMSKQIVKKTVKQLEAAKNEDGTDKILARFDALEARMSKLEEGSTEDEDEKNLEDGEEQVSDEDAAKKDLPAKDPDAEPETEADEKAELSEGDGEPDGDEGKEVPAEPVKKKLSRADQTANLKKLAATLGFRLAPAGSAEGKKSDVKNFSVLVAEKTKELGDATKAMTFCLKNHKAEYAEHRKAFVK